MRFRKIEMKNFKPYKGVLTLEFPRYEDKQILIIYGGNGAGKTSFSDALKWCLYGWIPTAGEKIRVATERDSWRCIYGTHKGVSLDDPFMHVYLWLDHNSDQYLIKRLVKPLTPHPTSHTQIRTDLEVLVNGKLSNSPREAIEALLPTATNQFFMFHGEDIRKMSQKHPEETRKAIELILEAETVRKAINDLEAVAKDVEADLDQERRKAGGLAQLLQAKAYSEQKIQELQRKIQEYQKQLEENKISLEDVSRKLRAHEVSSQLMGRLEEAKARLNELEEQKARLKAREMDLILALPRKIILPELKAILSKKEDRHKKIEEIKMEIKEKEALRDFGLRLVNQEICICGTKLTEVQKAYIQREIENYSATIKQLENMLEPEDPTYYELRETIASIEGLHVDFERHYRDLDAITLSIDEVKSRIKGIEKDLGGIDITQVRDWENTRSRLEKSIGSLEALIERTRQDLKTEEMYKNRIELNIQKMETRDQIKDNLKSQLELLEGSIEAFKYILQELVELKRNKISQEATDIFRKLTNKPDEYDRIEIDSFYDLNVMDKNNNVIEREQLSTGEREVVALSFILGLMKASEKDAPLVLDTFFVHLDEAHFSNIVKSLPTFASQIILILTDLEYKNLKERAPAKFFDHVAGVWRVERNQSLEVSTIVVEE